MFVEVDSFGSVSCGGGEREYEVGDGSCSGIQSSMAAGVEAELCNEEGVVGEGGDANYVRDELCDDVVGGCCKGAIPVSPIGWGCVSVVVVEDIAAQ